MALTNFVDGATKIMAAWLNKIDVLYVTVFGEAATAAAARTALLGASNGYVIQAAQARYTTNLAVTTSIPIDTTKPQITEGSEILSVGITPLNTGNKLHIRAVVPYQFINASGTDTVLVASLHVGGANDALATATAALAASITTASNNWGTLTIDHVYTAGSTGALTFSVRVGNAAGQSGSTYINNQYFGSVVTSTISIMEVRG